MKKVLFLMLFLTLLGTAGMNAQVRIGGNAAPHAAAILDLNATDAANNGTKTLALPRVDFDDVSDLLDGTNTPPDGSLVYNTNTTLGEGLYYWLTDKWIKLGSGGSEALNVTAELNEDYEPTAANDIILFKTTVGRSLTLPVTGIPVGKKFYISDQGNSGLDMGICDCLRDAKDSVVWPGLPAVVMYVGDGKWLNLNSY